VSRFLLTISLILIFFLSNSNLQSQDIPNGDSTYWTSGMVTSLLFNQVSFTNWARGGESSISAAAGFKYNLDYKRKDTMLIWQNIFDFGYGVMNTDQFNWRTTEDRIDITSRFGYKATKDYYYSILMNFKTQFSAGYDFPNDSVIVSNFMAPGYLIISLGMEYRPDSDLSIMLSPVSGRAIIVNDQNLADRGAYGVKRAVTDGEGNILQPGEKLALNLGAFFKLLYKKEVFENIFFDTKLELFNDYSDNNKRNRKNIDVNSETRIRMRVNEYISTTLFMHLVYDEDIAIPVFEDIEGVRTKVGEGPRLQIRQSFGVGLQYAF